MPRRFALALVALLLLLLGALFVGRRLRSSAPAAHVVPTLRPTPLIPPTPIPARRLSLYFESGQDDQLHPEARDVPAALDDVAFLRSVAGAVMDGPRRPDFLRPFPEGWTLRGAYLLRDGIAVIDLSPPPIAVPREPGTPAGPHWPAGSHEEDVAIQSLAVTLAKNLPAVTRVVLLIAGDAAETLGGHADLTHPIAPDLRRAADEPPGEPPARAPAVIPAPTVAPVSPATARPAPPTAVPARPHRAAGERA